MSIEKPIRAEKDPLPDAPQKVAEQVAQKFFHAGPDAVSRQRAVRENLLGAVQSAVLIPFIFYVYTYFKEVGPLGWGTTGFLVAYHLLAAVGLYFQERTEFHTKVQMRGDWADHVGAFWLVGCVFGPLLGWILTSGVLSITQGSWQWLYGARVFLGAGLPVLTALPLTRYVRGKSTLVALPLLLGVTMIPVLTAVDASRDLRDGPMVRNVQATGKSELYLMHTERKLGVR